MEVWMEGGPKEHRIASSEVSAREQSHAPMQAIPSAAGQLIARPGLSKGPGRRATLDIEIVLVSALVAGCLVWLQAPIVLRAPAGLLLVLFLPGYSLAVAMFPRTGEFQTLQWLALSIGTSLALVPVLALALVHTSWGIRPVPIIAAETACTLVAGAIGWYRRYQSGSPDLGITGRVSSALTWERASRLPLILIGGGLAIGGVAFVLSVVLPSAPPTAFYALGSMGLAENYPSSVTAGQEVTVQLGITSHESAPVNYQIDVASDDKILKSSESFQVQPGAEWRGSISFAAPAQPGDNREVQLNLLNDGKPYRQLRLWLNVQADSGPS